MIDWGLIRCALGWHEWRPYREGVLHCDRCTYLRFLHGGSSAKPVDPAYAAYRAAGEAGRYAEDPRD